MIEQVGRYKGGALDSLFSGIREVYISPAVGKRIYIHINVCWLCLEFLRMQYVKQTKWVVIWRIRHLINSQTKCLIFKHHLIKSQTERMA
jgi:hypothetical protein